jgi:hypothetical protein
LVSDLVCHLVAPFGDRSKIVPWPVTVDQAVTNRANRLTLDHRVWLVVGDHLSVDGPAQVFGGCGRGVGLKYTQQDVSTVLRHFLSR